MYYRDTDLKFVVHNYYSVLPKELDFFLAECNSLEFIRFGHIQLFRARDGAVIDLAAPAFFWMRQDEKYRFFRKDCDQSEKLVEHLYFDFSGERSERMVTALESLYPSGMFHPRNPKEVCDIFFQILRLYRIDPVAKLPEIVTLMEKLMFIAYDSARTLVADEKDAYGLEEIAEKLRSEPFRKYDFNDMAHEAGLSMDHFRCLFRKRHQMTPLAYLHHQRMIRAAELLEKTDLRIKEIAYTCNFSSEMDFSRDFKKYSGFSPRNYRNLYRS